MLKTKKKPKKKTLMNKADKLWSQIILLGGNCEICGKPATNPHHIVGRKNMNLRYDLRNGCRLCFQHHTGNKVSAHNDPVWFIGWVEMARTEDYIHLLNTRNETVTTTIEWYQEHIERLQNILKEGEDGFI